jgi:hypothetical protein
MGFTKQKTVTVLAEDFLWEDAVCHVEFEHDGRHYLVQAKQDEDAGNPREESDHAWVWATTAGAGYSDKHAMSLDDWEGMDKAERKKYLCYPLGLLRHSGDTVYIGDNAHRADPGGWDSGCMGVAYMAKKEAVAAWGGEGAALLTKKIRLAALEGLKSEAAEMNLWLQGGVYGVSIMCLETEQEESCWGHYCDGKEELWQAMEELLPGDMTDEAAKVVADSVEWAW